MRFLQAMLLILGPTALGTVAGYFGLILAISALQKPGGEPWQAGFGQYLGGLFCGAPLGSLLGLASGIAAIQSQDEDRSWNLVVWLGILVGLVAGSFLSFRLNIHEATSWYGTSIFVAACGTLGGLIAGLASSFRESARERR